MGGQLEPGFLDPPCIDWIEIRARVVEMLRAMHLPFGQRVFTNQERPIQETGVPCCVVYTTSEDASRRTAAPVRDQCELELIVVLTMGVPPNPDADKDLAQASDGVDDELGRVARAVRLRFGRDHTLGGLVESCRYKRGEYEGLPHGAMRYGAHRLYFAVTYTFAEPERPESGFPPLRSVESTSRSGGEHSPAINDYTKLGP